MEGIILAVLTGLLFFTAAQLRVKNHPVRKRIVSFGAGTATAYVLLIMLPEFYESGHPGIYALPLLIGFSVVHIAEKFLHQHFHGHNLYDAHVKLHIILTSIYYLIIGYMLVLLAHTSFRQALLLFVPVVFHGITDQLPRVSSVKTPILLLTASMPIIGGLIAILFAFTVVANAFVLGIIAGILLYTVTREVIPEDNQGFPIYYIIGAGTLSLITLLF